MLTELIPSVWLRVLVAIVMLVVSQLAIFGGFVIVQMWKERDL